MIGRPADPVLAAALERVLAGQGAMLATIAAAKGSTPRVPGTRMLIDATDIVGSVGGGQLEFEIIAAAREKLSAGALETTCRHFILGPDLRQCCGGALDIVLERLTPDSVSWLTQILEWERLGTSWECSLTLGATSAERQLRACGDAPVDSGTARLQKTEAGAMLAEISGRPWSQLYLFGAGHVGRALIRLLGDLPFHVVWSDAREDIFPPDLPGNVQLDAGVGIGEMIKAAPEDAHFLVMTHSHALDFEIVAAILAKGRFGSLGLIGSDTKRARFVQRLRADGVPPQRLARLQCPVGIPGIKSKVPAAIAIAVAADILVQDQALRQAATGVQLAG